MQPGQELDYIDFEAICPTTSIALSRCYLTRLPTSIRPGRSASRRWFEGWLHVLLEDADPKQWIIALGSYGYDWTERREEGGADQFSRSDEPRELRRRRRRRRWPRRITIPISITRTRTRTTPSGSSMSSHF